MWTGLNVLDRPFFGAKGPNQREKSIGKLSVDPQLPILPGRAAAPELTGPDETYVVERGTFLCSVFC